MSSNLLLHFAVPVWGKAYLDTYLDVCLPAQLSKNNLGYIHSKAHIYTIYTYKENVAYIRAASSFHVLEKIVSVKFELIENIVQSDNKYIVKTDCYRHAIAQAVAGDAALFALNSDIFLADGFIKKVADVLKKGVRLVEVPGSRAVKSDLVAALGPYRNTDGVSIAVPPKDLARLWLQNRHSQLTQHQVEGVLGEPFHPSHLMWDVGTEGVIIRAFHVYPIVTRPLNVDAEKFTSTIDDDLASHLSINDAERYYATDSRELFCCELSPAEYHIEQDISRGDLNSVVDFYLMYARSNLENLNREMIVTHCDDLSTAWIDQRAASADFVDQIMERYGERQKLATQKELSMPSLMSSDPISSSDSEALAEADRLMSIGAHIPLSLRERCLLFHLRQSPSRFDLIAQLSNVLLEQGKHIPLIVQQRALEYYINEDPSREDLRERLKRVLIGIETINSPPPNVRSQFPSNVGSYQRSKRKLSFWK